MPIEYYKQEKRVYVVWCSYKDCSFWVTKAKTALKARYNVAARTEYPVSMLKAKSLDKIFKDNHKEMIELCCSGVDNSDDFSEEKPIPFEVVEDCD